MTVTVAIMQPYAFPYIGYFQLIRAADRFVFYDDVQFIKRGWINRNRIANQGHAALFSIPVTGASRDAAIRDVACAADARWLRKFLQQIRHEYGRAPFHREVADLIAACFEGAEGLPISELAIRSVQGVMDYLGEPFEAHRSGADLPNPEGLRGQARVIDITLRLGGGRYVNLPGGAALYDPGAFAARGLDLLFIRDRSGPYPQGGPDFAPHLSIIDVLMHNSPEQVRAMLGRHELIRGADLRAPAEGAPE